MTKISEKSILREKLCALETTRHQLLFDVPLTEPQRIGIRGLFLEYEYLVWQTFQKK